MHLNAELNFGQVFFIIVWNLLCFLSYHFLSIFCFLALIRELLNLNFFTCFIAILSSYNRGILTPILGRVGGEAPCVVCDWNLNSIWVEDFFKLSKISAFLNVHQFDTFYLTETFLDSLTSSEDPRLAIAGYKLFRCDHPSNLRRDGVCIYFKDHLPLAIRPNLTILD